MHISRKLAAVLFADIQGYTAWMQRDEEQAFHLLKRFQEVLANQVKEHQGNVVKNYGDGSICLFPNVSEALSCAKEVQVLMSEHPRVPLRIGLHVGDVTITDEDVYGDPVNVASRIESIGIPGSILMSKSFFQKVKNLPRFDFQSMGSFIFKNVEEPIEVYALANPGITVPKRHQLKSGLKSKNKVSFFVKGVIIFLLVLFISSILYKYSSQVSQNENGMLDSNYSIAVLPFKDLSATQEFKYLGFGMAADIINLLGKVPQLKVIGSTSSFSFDDKNIDIPTIADILNINYVLEGNILRNNDNIKIGLQLVDGKTGKSIWSQQFNEQIENIFAAQEKMVSETCHELKISIAEDVLGSSSTPEVKAHLLFLQSEFLRVKSFFNEMNKIEEILLAAYALDSTYMPVLYGLAAMPFRKHRYAIMEFSDAKNRMFKYLQKMITTDSSSYYTNFADALYHLDFKFDFQRVFEKLNKVINQNNTDILVMSGSGYYIGLNDLDRGIYQVEKAISRDPLYSWNYWNLGYLYYYNQQYDQSFDMLKKFSDLMETSYFFDMFSLIRTRQGNFIEAMDFAKQIEDPGRKIYVEMVIHHYNHSTDRAHALLEQLRNQYSDMHLEIAEGYALTQNLTQAFQWLEKAYEEKDGDLSSIKYNVSLQNLHHDPRWISFLSKLGFSLN